MKEGLKYHGLRNAVGLSSKEYREIYKSWYRMVSRCYSQNNASFEHYQKRGIEVCVEWRYSFENFLVWALDNGWDASLSLDRIDNDKGYSPDNCRWATMKQQGRNRSSCLYITHNGETKCLMEWCEEFGLPHYLPYNRIRRGVTDFDEIFSTVSRKNGGVLHY